MLSFNSSDLLRVQPLLLLKPLYFFFEGKVFFNAQVFFLSFEAQLSLNEAQFFFVEGHWTSDTHHLICKNPQVIIILFLLRNQYILHLLGFFESDV